MLFRLHRLALRLRPLRRGCLAVAALSIALGLFALGDLTHTQSTLLRLSLLFSLWMLMLYAFIQLFQRIPPPILPKLPWWERVWQRLHLWLYHLLAVAVLVAGLALVSISMKLWWL
ncbi:MAG TPA: hypothetical protein VNR18_08265 [Hyphomicrobiales bacterium]|nr:hypothetical protein [Hyphomicrobiales bacterium]